MLLKVLEDERVIEVKNEPYVLTSAALANVGDTIAHTHRLAAQELAQL